MRKEYDLEHGRPNPYARRLGHAGRRDLFARFLEAEHLVRLDAEVAAQFPSDRAVNDALRLVIELRDLASRAPKKAAGRSAKPRHARSR